jgi:hypothetical protein
VLRLPERAIPRKKKNKVAWAPPVIDVRLLEAGGPVVEALRSAARGRRVWLLPGGWPWGRCVLGLSGGGKCWGRKGGIASAERRGRWWERSSRRSGAVVVTDTEQRRPVQVRTCPFDGIGTLEG